MSNFDGDNLICPKCNIKCPLYNGTRNHLNYNILKEHEKEKNEFENVLEKR